MPLKINEAKQRINNALQNALKQSIDDVYNSAKENCPVRTGALKEDIQKEVEEKEGVVYNTKDYAPFVALGTRKQPANPYLQKALFGNTGKIISNFAKELGNI